jgi:hypothetical protein
VRCQARRRQLAAVAHRELERQQEGRPSGLPSARQYSSGRRMVVTERSASVITQRWSSGCRKPRRFAATDGLRSRSRAGPARRARPSRLTGGAAGSCKGSMRAASIRANRALGGDHPTEGEEGGHHWPCSNRLLAWLRRLGRSAPHRRSGACTSPRSQKHVPRTRGGPRGLPGGVGGL